MTTALAADRADWDIGNSLGKLERECDRFTAATVRHAV
jgi:hypothetical protein